MRHPRLHLVLAFLIAVGVVAQTATQAYALPGRSASAADERSLHRGAIHEQRLKVLGPLETYLKTYAQWYLPVDQKKDSGRKLIDVLLREHGDGYNLVFLYWYESRYKENYYCQYTKAFLEVHEKNPEFIKAYEDAARRVLGRSMAPDLASYSCQANTPPLVVSEAIRQIDGQLRNMILETEATWNFGVNPCRVQVLADGKTGTDLQTALESCPSLGIEWIVEPTLDPTLDSSPYVLD